jgi:hypothetical protein
LLLNVAALIAGLAGYALAFANDRTGKAKNSAAR